MVIIFHRLHLAHCLFLACQNQIWQTVFMLGRRQRTCIVCDQWYFLWVWNSLWTQSHDKIPESALCIRLAYLEKNPFVLIDEWILPLFGVNSVTSVKSHSTQYLKLALSLKLCAFRQTGWKPAWICGVRCSSDPS